MKTTDWEDMMEMHHNNAGMTNPRNLLNRIPEHQLFLIGQFTNLKPVPLGKLAKSLGLTVKVSTLEPGISGLIETFENGYRIRVNRYESRERQRFTLAHEIAHFLLHRAIIDNSGDIKDNVLYRSTQTEKVEVEANKLAAELILPSYYFNKDLKKYDNLSEDEKIEQLSENWQVSKAVIVLKLGKKL